MDIERLPDIPVGSSPAGRRWPVSTVLRLGWHLFRMPAAGRHLRNGRQPAQLHGALHSIARDRQAVTFHYNVSNKFCALWLDQRMVYSCAYFETADEDLDMAQAHKLDYICRKLRLRPGDRLLDIGCGWGGLVIHAAERYGVEALGITLSRNGERRALILPRWKRSRDPSRALNIPPRAAGCLRRRAGQHAVTVPSRRPLRAAL
jgi:Mycolic acid cyclopropane synthetase